MALLTQAPKGTQDLYPPKSSKWQVVEDVMRSEATIHGFGEVRTPVFEHTELFLRSVGDTTDVVEKGLEKMRKKVGEECTEVVIASLTQTKEDQIKEIGDLLYHLTVLRVEKGISMEDVNAELERRAQKTHNLKAERKPIEHL